MAYRNGTYIAFHAAGTSDPTASDIKYFNLMKAWRDHPEIEFGFVDSHDKTAAVRDTSLKSTLRTRLAERLRNSKNMLLILGQTTRLDADWVPFEIQYAADTCKVPIIVAYTDYTSIFRPADLVGLWPSALRSRIENQTVRAIHIPFNKQAMYSAMAQFSHNNPPASALNFYNLEAHRQFGINV
jgi:hypothetical protein